MGQNSQGQGDRHGLLSHPLTAGMACLSSLPHLSTSPSLPPLSLYLTYSLLLSSPPPLLPCLSLLSLPPFLSHILCLASSSIYKYHMHMPVCSPFLPTCLLHTSFCLYLKLSLSLDLPLPSDILSTIMHYSMAGFTHSVFLSSLYSRYLTCHPAITLFLA